MKKHMPMQWLFRLATLGIVIVLLSGCVALLWQMRQGSMVSYAVSAVPAIPADVSVVDPPSLSAATVNAIFAQVGSPMAGTGATVETLSRQYHIDDAFALGVWYTETNDGEAGVGSADRNPGSVRGSPGYPSAWDGYTIYPSYTAAIINWFSILNGRYISSGLTTVYSIARPYVGTSSYPLWAGKVINLIYRYRGIAPPPPANTPTPNPTAKPTPRPKPVPTLSPAMVVQAHRLASLLPHDSQSFVRSSQGVSNEAHRITPAQVVVPVATTTQSSPLSPMVLNLILFSGLLSALLIALFARSIGRGAPLKKAVTIAHMPNTAAQRMSILSPVDTEAGLVVTGAARSLALAAPVALAGNRQSHRSVPMFDVTPLPPVSHQDAARWLPAPETTTEALSQLSPLIPLPTPPGRQFSPSSVPLVSPAASVFPVSPVRPGGTVKPVRPLPLPSRPRQTDALPRRTILMPSNSNPRIPATANTANTGTARPAGLLSRYRDEHPL